MKIYTLRVIMICVLMTGIQLQPYAQNNIATENALPGNPKSEWDITGAGDTTIQGFATLMSANKGSPVNFKITTDAGVQFTINIYRLGYYQGNGARLVANLGTFSGIKQSPCFYQPATGLLDCGNWVSQATWNIPSTAVSGIYIAKLTRNDNGGASHIAFIVRDDAASVDLIFKTSDATWQAYNTYGGNNFYTGTVAGFPGGRAVKISYNRPFYTRAGSEDWLFRAEYPMIRWLERNGYSMKYMTDMDMERSPLDFNNFRVFLSVGHDEYWSGTERNNVENARNNGKHLAFFSGNEVYWKTRWENSVDGTNTPLRTLVCYKEGGLGENACNGKCDPTNTWTGLWRSGDPAIYPGSDGNKPENSLSGTISWRDSTDAIKVPSTFKNNRFWRNTAIATIPDGTTTILPQGTLGYEWSWENPAYQQFYPNKRILLSSTSFNGRFHKMSLYKHSSGAWVFGAGTVQWSWGLSEIHDGGNKPPSLIMEQAAVNLLADMNAQPTTLQADLSPASASTDVSPPSIHISSPANNSTATNKLSVTVSGTATDLGGIVAGVEYSLDGGATWQVASGTDNWSFSFIPVTAGSLTIRIRGFDDSGNSPAAGNETSLTLNIADNPITGNYSLFPATNPGSVSTRDQINGTVLGMKFRTSVNGYISGVRFFKASTDIGTHQGLLFTTGGTLLAQANFTTETSSGWQEVSFSNPVAITANTTYVVAYLSSKGYYSYLQGYFLSPHYNGPITATADRFDDKNGLIFYSNTPVLPTNNYNSSSYMVDVVFNTTIAPDITPPFVISTSPQANATEVPLGSNIVINFNEEILQSSINNLSVQLTSGGSSIPATITYQSNFRKIIITPSSPLLNSTLYSVLIHGGGGTNVIKDIAGNTLAADYSFNFTGKSPAPPVPLDGNGGPILVINDPSNPFSIYPVEILRAEGWNSFKALPLTSVDASVLANYDVVILGNIPLSSSAASMLTNFVNNGGTLIAFRPNTNLYPLMGITPASGTISDKYLLLNTSSVAAAGLVSETIQFHGTADQVNLNAGTSVLGTLYSNATTPTNYPAITLRNVGANGGQAIAFTYDLARSVVLTRQGNPAWAGQERDGVQVIRTDDLFFGNSSTDPQPDWIDFTKIAIPQADEQMRLLSKLILQGNFDKKPLPRFWFLPSGKKAAIVMSGDDHGYNSTSDIFNKFKTNGPNTPQDVADWKAIRGTSYIYPSTPITDADIAQFQNDGFEISLHLNTNCSNWTPASWRQNWKDQWNQMKDVYPSIKNAMTHRTHCVPWTDWVNQAKMEAELGIRLDANYYFYPEAWIQNRSGMFTGSGMPMRFADVDGTMIDCYQVATQMTDESGQAYPQVVNELLNKATGAEGYYGVFCANMHTDIFPSFNSDLIVSSALAKNIPVVSAKQMLDWIDGRNNSFINNFSWSSNTLNFTINADVRALNMKGMLPVTVNNLRLVNIKRNNVLLTITNEVIKEVEYAFFDATSGAYVATYAIDATPPVISNIVATPNSNGTAVITWTTDENSDSKVDYGTSPSSLTVSVSNAGLVQQHSIMVTGLLGQATYYFRVSSKDAAGNQAVSPTPPVAPLQFTTPATVCAADNLTSEFLQGNPDNNTVVINNVNGEVVLKQPFIEEQFVGTTIPAGWNSAIWNTGGSISFAGGIASLNGTSLYTNQSFLVGSSIEFSAKFALANFQNIGFAANSNLDPYWVVVGRGSPGNTVQDLYVRTSDGIQISLGTDLLNAYHTFRIARTTTGFTIFVDNIQKAIVNKTISSPLIFIASDFNVDGITLTVDYFRNFTGGYPASGIFSSRILSLSANSTSSTVSWNSSVPAGTGLSIAVRSGTTSTPDASWTAFAAVSNNQSISVAGTFVQYQATLTSSNSSLTPALNDIQFTCSGTVDNSPPVISNIVATPNSNGTAVITWTTDENSDSKVDYGTSPSSLTVSASNNTLIQQHSITLSNLQAQTTYYFRVSSKDAAGNQAVSPAPPAAPLQFTIPGSNPIVCATDNLSSEFLQGNPDNNTVVVNNVNGEVILKQSSTEEQFDGTTIPAGWNTGIWKTGGTTSFAGSTAILNGTSLYTTQTFLSGATVEFSAKFSQTTYQNIGFAANSNLDPYWVVVGRGSPANTVQDLYVRTSDGIQVSLGTDLLNAYHTFRIARTTTGFTIFVDNIQKAIVNKTISSPLIFIASDFNVDGITLTVDYFRNFTGGYPASGIFSSRILSLSANSTSSTVSWNSSVPAGTGLSIAVRSGTTSTPDASWTAFAAVSNNQSISVAGTFVQYQATLTSSNSSLTPALNDIQFTCSGTVDNSPPVISNIVATPNSNGTAVITWTTDENSDSKVDYGTSPSSLTVSASNNTLIQQHSITLSNLQAQTTYYFRVSSKDAAGNQAVSPAPPAAPLQFTIPGSNPIVCATDNLSSEFLQGNPDNNTVVVNNVNGEVILKQSSTEEQFDGTTIPAGWNTGIWKTGGTTSFAGSTAILNGTSLYTTQTFLSGATVEFSAKFSQTTYQNIGFAANSNLDPYWVVVGRGSPANTVQDLYVRTSDGIQISLGTDLLNAYHTFRIARTTTGFTIFVDNIQKAIVNKTISSPLIFIASDFNVDGITLTVDYFRNFTGGYPASGIFSSRILSLSANSTSSTVSWNSSVPAGTGLSIAVRSGTTSTPDASWTAFAAVSNNQSISVAGTFVQYQATLTSSNSSLTPALNDIQFTCATALQSPPVTINSSDRNSLTPKTTIEEFKLEQNHPNPFQNSTYISYVVPKQVHVVITIYDIQGRIIRNIDEGLRRPGKYTIEVNMDNKHGKMYMYRMQAGDFSATKKMILE